MPFVNYLKYLRIKKGLKRPALAKTINRSVISLRKYEEGSTRVSEDLAIKLADILGGKPIQLTGHVRQIYLPRSEYKKIANALPPVNYYKKPSTIASLLNRPLHKISLKDCHAIIFTKKSPNP